MHNGLRMEASCVSVWAVTTRICGLSTVSVSFLGVRTPPHPSLCSSLSTPRSPDRTHTDTGDAMSRAYASLFFPVLLTIFLTRSVPAGQDTTVIAHWHCDEPSGMVLFDSSGLGHDAYLSGTIAVNGVAGMARHFNGGWDYGEISYPSSMFLNMSDNESFEISLWVRTTATEGTILRRGLAPTPGFLIGMHEGHVVGIIGNREDSSSPDTLLRITSSDRLNDATWHQIVLTRDRQARTINLRVDGVQEPPSPDPVTFPLASDRPMTLGRWENNVYPSYFFGRSRRDRDLHVGTGGHRCRHAAPPEVQ